MSYPALNEVHARLSVPHRLFESAITYARLTDWTTHYPAPPPDGKVEVILDSGVILPRKPLPRLGIHPTSSHFQVHSGFPGKGILYESDCLATPSAEVRKALIGFRVVDTAAPSFSQNQRIHLLGQCTRLQPRFLEPA